MKYRFEMFEYSYRECELIHSFISPESVIRSICEDYIMDCTDCPFGKSPDRRCDHVVENADFWTIAKHFLTIVNGDYGCHLIMMYYDDDTHCGQIAFTEEGIMPRVWDSPYDIYPEDLDFISKKNLEFSNEIMELPGVFYKIAENEIIYDINELKELEGIPTEEKEIKTEEKETFEMANQTTYEWKAGPYPSETASSEDYIIFYGTPDGEGGFDTARAFVHWDATRQRWDGVSSNWIVFAILRVPKNPKVIFEMGD